MDILLKIIDIIIGGCDIFIVKRFDTQLNDFWDWGEATTFANHIQILTSSWKVEGRSALIMFHFALIYILYSELFQSTIPSLEERKRERENQIHQFTSDIRLPFESHQLGCFDGALTTDPMRTAGGFSV